MKRVVALTAALTLALLGCGSSQTHHLPPFEKTGEIVLRNGGASFDEYRVVGPRINMSERPDGTWAGTIRDQVWDVSVTDTEIRGVNIQLKLQRLKGGIIIRGLAEGGINHFEISPGGLLVSSPRGSLTLPRYSPTSFGPDGQVKFVGEAGTEQPPWPQIAFALIGAF